MSRRSFLSAGGGALMIASIPSFPPRLLRFGSHPGGAPAERSRKAAMAVGDEPAITVRLIRPADQLDLLLEFDGVTFDGATNELHSVDGGDPLMRVILGAQHTVEDALDDVIGVPPDTAATDGRTAGQSRLVVSIPTPLSFTVDSLLDTALWALRTPAGAGVPNDDETMLELPTGLAMSPAEPAIINATGSPRTEADVTELWRVGLRPATGRSLAMLAVQNVNASDGVLNPVPNADVRDDLVSNTTGIEPASARRLELSSHGAFARLNGNWPDAPVKRWRQTIETGRDVVAEVIEEGFLLPFGHAVKVLDVNSRRLVLDDDGEPVASLEHERFLCIDAPTVTFDGEPGEHDDGMEFRRNGGRGLPFRSVTATPTEWIPIDTVALTDDNGDIPGVFDAVVKGTNDLLPVSFTADDRAGAGGISFGTGATIVDKDHAFDTAPGGTLERLAGVLSSPGSEWRRTLDLGGQAVAFADELAEGLGRTTFATNQIQLLMNQAVGAIGDELSDAFRLGVFPEVELAEIVDDAISAAVGDGLAELVVFLHDRWLDFGIDADNFDQAFLKLQDSAEKALGGAARAVAAIDLVAEVFNQTVGVGLDLIDLTQEWSAEDALGTASKILGLIPLHEVLPNIDLGGAIPGLDIPGLDVTVDENGFKAVFAFEPKIVSVPPLGFIVNGNDNRAFVENLTCVPIAGEPENTLTIRLDDITLQIPPIVNLVELDFSRVEVIESSTDGLLVDPRLEDWRWGSSLTWLKPLTDLLDKLGDGLIDITPTALEIATDFPLPAIELGVVSISNVAIFSGLDLPFTDGLVPDVSLGLGSAAQPVEISVLGYGADFYIEVDISPGGGGLRRLTASLELNAKLVGIDIVVAKADVTLRVSALFRLKDGDVTLIGSIAIEGNIEVLGLLDVSVGIVGTVRYRSSHEDLKLSGSLTYCVDTFLGGASGSIPIGDVTFDLSRSGGGAAGLRSFAGALTGATTDTATTTTTAAAADDNGGPPSFGDRFTTTEWADEYTAAFA